MSDQVTQELGEADKCTMDSFTRTVIKQMFENDNDTVYLSAVLKADDGTTAELEFKLSILSLNGIKTRYEDDNDASNS